MCQKILSNLASVLEYNNYKSEDVFMSAPVFAIQTGTAEKKMTVSFKLLLSLYAIIPLCLLIQFVDTFFLQNYLKVNLPSSPTHFLLFQILFGTPHIIASTFLLVGSVEYLKYYRRNIIGLTLLLAIMFGVGSLFIPYKVFYIFVAAWTVYHVLKQQHGIVRGLCRLPTMAYYVLLSLSVVAGLCVYVGIFLKNSLEAEQAQYIQQLSGLLCACLVLITFYYQKFVKTTFGKFFLWSNVLLVVVSFYFYVQQYYFLAILVPRLVHDATAYVVYVTHDFNKHHIQPQNILYRWAGKLKINIFLVLPVTSFALAFVLQAYGDLIVSSLTEIFFGIEIRKVITVGLLGYLALMHYYTEAITWKVGSPYRRYIGFSE